MALNVTMLFEMRDQLVLRKLLGAAQPSPHGIVDLHDNISIDNVLLHVVLFLDVRSMCFTLIRMYFGLNSGVAR